MLPDRHIIIMPTVATDIPTRHTMEQRGDIAQRGQFPNKKFKT